MRRGGGGCGGGRSRLTKRDDKRLEGCAAADLKRQTMKPAMQPTDERASERDDRPTNLDQPRRCANDAVEWRGDGQATVRSGAELTHPLCDSRAGLTSVSSRVVPRCLSPSPVAPMRAWCGRRRRRRWRSLASRRARWRRRQSRTRLGSCGAAAAASQPSQSRQSAAGLTAQRDANEHTSLTTSAQRHRKKKKEQRSTRYMIGEQSNGVSVCRDRWLLTLRQRVYEFASRSRIRTNSYATLQKRRARAGHLASEPRNRRRSLASVCRGWPRGWGL